MIGMTPIIRLVELAIWSTCLAGERNPVSILLVAKPESGKSEVISMFRDNRNTITVTNFTAYGLVMQIFPKMQDNIGSTLLLIPDFINLLSYNSSTVASLTQTLKSFMEEGVVGIHTKNVNIDFDRPITGGVITSITPGEFKGVRRSWTRSGVLSRFIILSYQHHNGTQIQIMDMLEEHVAKLRQSRPKLLLPERPVVVEADGRLLRPIRSLVSKYARKMEMVDEMYGYRMQLHFQRLVAAHALTEGRDTVTKIDVDSVCTLLEMYANLDFNGI